MWQFRRLWNLAPAFVACLYSDEVVWAMEAEAHQYPPTSTTW